MMRKTKKPVSFLASLAIIFCIHAGIAIVELAAFPVDAFTFRPWEALRCYYFSSVIGPFYPNRHIVMTEQGDLGHHTPLALYRSVEWSTDRYGYRKKDSQTARYPIVILGDSNMVGSNMTQEDMLSEALGRRLGIPVYTFSPARIEKFMYGERFIQHPPDVVILGSIEGNISTIAPLRKKYFYIVGNAQPLPIILREAFVILDRICTARMINSFRSNSERRLKKSCEKVEGSFSKSSAHGKPDQAPHEMMFASGLSNTQDVSEEDVRRIVSILKEHKEVLDARHIRFIYLPIPDKENIYFDKMPGSAKQPVFLSKLISLARREGIEVIDTESAFRKARQEDEETLLYYPDDSHWNEHAVRITADLLADALRNPRGGAKNN